MRSISIPRSSIWGACNHPEHPYDDPRVTVIIDDARNAFKDAAAANL